MLISYCPIKLFYDRLQLERLIVFAKYFKLLNDLNMSNY